MEFLETRKEVWWVIECNVCKVEGFSIDHSDLIGTIEERKQDHRDALVVAGWKFKTGFTLKNHEMERLYHAICPGCQEWLLGDDDCE